MSQQNLRVVPLTTAAANRVVATLHRHHGICPPALAYFSIGVVDETGLLRGAAIGARPPNRNSDDGMTCEVVRVATDGCPNACSALYGAAGRAAREMGFARVITYTLDSETGSSLRGVGWKREADGIESWWHRYPEKSALENRTVILRPHHSQGKVRWALQICEKVTIDMQRFSAGGEQGQGALPFEPGMGETA